MRWLLISIACSLLPATASADQRVDHHFFESKIRPVLVKHCYLCHSEAAEKNKKLGANLRLDSRAGMRQGGDSGPAVVAGDADASLLVNALRFKDLQMPPKQKLPDHVIADFVKWIEMGAPDPRVESAGASTKAATRPGKEHWSFQPLRHSPVSDDGASTWPINDIDRYVLARLQENDLSPAADAEPHVLIRRLSFDLIGLPPTPDDIAVFEADFAQDRNGAVTQLVDRLLSSEQFGERWGRHWLDLVRYAETNGGDRNVIWPNAWRYRDYVIDAFNHDVPFDQFIREQIAGDLLPSDSQPDRDRQLIATGMLTMGPKLFMETKAERFKMDVVDEQMDVVGRAVLGLTISCARCHDHKFDDISTEDYYALAGIFRSTYLLYGEAAPAGNQYGHDRPLQPIGKDCEKLVGPAENWKKKVADQTAARNKARSDRYRVVRQKAALENKLKMLSMRSASATEVSKVQQEIEDLTTQIEQWDAKIEKLDEELQQTVDHPPTLPDYAMAVRDANEVEDCRVRIRGEYNQLGEPVPRGFLSAVPHSRREIPAGESGRLQLAEWLTDAQNPLTARVAVNRIWQHLFGEGLVRSVDNFGVTGEAPTHPELLDHLAIVFQDDGWSVKQMIRRIVLSRVYQQSSHYDARGYQRDPANRLLWRMNRRRLEAESLRDAMMFVSGALDGSRPDGSAVSREFAKERELNATVQLSQEQLSGHMRSVYLPVARMSLPVMMRIWDFPDPSLLAGRRSDRLKADQQLFFMNSPFVIKHSALTAKRILAKAEANQDRMRFSPVVGD